MARQLRTSCFGFGPGASEDLRAECRARPVIALQRHFPSKDRGGYVVVVHVAVLVQMVLERLGALVGCRVVAHVASSRSRSQMSMSSVCVASGPNTSAASNDTA